MATKSSLKSEVQFSAELMTSIRKEARDSNHLKPNRVNRSLFSTSSKSNSSELANNLWSFFRLSFKPDANSLVIDTIRYPLAVAYRVNPSTWDSIAALFSDDDSRAYIAQRVSDGLGFSPTCWSTHQAGIYTRPVSSLMYGIWSLYTLRLSVQGFTPKIWAASVILCRFCSAMHKSIAKKVKVLEN